MPRSRFVGIPLNLRSARVHIYESRNALFSRSRERDETEDERRGGRAFLCGTSIERWTSEGCNSIRGRKDAFSYLAGCRRFRCVSVCQVMEWSWNYTRNISVAELRWKVSWRREKVLLCWFDRGKVFRERKHGGNEWLWWLVLFWIITILAVIIICTMSGDFFFWGWLWFWMSVIILCGLRCSKASFSSDALDVKLLVMILLELWVWCNFICCEEFLFRWVEVVSFFIWICYENVVFISFCVSWTCNFSVSIRLLCALIVPEALEYTFLSRQLWIKNGGITSHDLSELPVSRNSISETFFFSFSSIEEL